MLYKASRGHCMPHKDCMPQLYHGSGQAETSAVITHMTRQSKARHCMSPHSKLYTIRLHCDIIRMIEAFLTLHDAFGVRGTPRTIPRGSQCQCEHRSHEKVPCRTVFAVTCRRVDGVSRNQLAIVCACFSRSLYAVPCMLNLPWCAPLHGV